MRHINKIFTLALLLAFMALPMQTAQARGLHEGQVVFGSDFTLASGETLTGDLVIFGGNVLVEKDAAVQGSIVAFGGNITLGETATVKKDVVTAGGKVTIDPKAKVEGDTITNVPAPTVNIPTMPVAPNAPVNISYNNNPLMDAVNVFFRALAMGALAMLVSVFLQPQVDRVGKAIVSQPFMAGSLGLLALFVTPVAVVILVITILLIPVAIIGLFLLMLAWLFGVIAMGQEVGERFAKAMNQTWAPVLTIGFGTFLLVLVGGFVGLVPVIGWLAPFLLGLMALGGAVMTWFGSRTYPRIVPPAAPIAPAEPIPPAS